MIKKRLLFLISFLLLILSGCAEFTGASAGKIIPPSGQDCPLAGEWKVMQELDTNGAGEKAAQPWIGSNVQFASSAVVFGGQVWDELTYKIKRVNAADYLMTKYIPDSSISVPKTQMVDVITVYAASNFLGEFMKLDDLSMITSIQNKVLLLKKVSDQADSALDAAVISAQDPNHVKKEGTSGVLLGLRIPAESGYTYKTLWVAADHHRLHPVLAAEHLFFPRTSGFWELKVQEIFTGEKTGNVLTARNVATKSPEKKKEKEKTGGQTEDQASIDPTVKIINYIGNDYVAIEEESAGVNKLQVLPVDKLFSPTVIKISDLLGDDGLSAYLNARKRAVAALSNKGVTLIEGDKAGENFGLARKNGHWFLVGRINYQSGGKSEQADFELKTIPPANLIFYDTLVLNWHNIKNRVPDALDAFTSPDKDIILVKTKNKLKVYTIGVEQLAESPIAEIDLLEGATVIMAEWATGFYVDNWEESFLSYGAQALPSNSVWIR